MIDKQEQDEPSGASAGSHRRPVAWMAFAGDCSESRALFLTRDAAIAAANEYGWFVAELFARTTLTDKERDAIGLARSVLEDHYRMSPIHNAADEALERLLDRLK